MLQILPNPSGNQYLLATIVKALSFLYIDIDAAKWIALINEQYGDFYESYPYCSASWNYRF